VGGQALVIALAVGGLAKTVDSNVIVRSVPEQETVVADGETEYRADVRIDTTQEPGKKITNGSWQVYLPDEVTFTRSQLPDPNNNPSQNSDDFFYNILMNSSFNKVDNYS
jgi:uncharacterized Ntn-hydrolase superfamily protein